MPSKEHNAAIFSPYTNPKRRSVTETQTDSRTDRQTNDSMKPIAGHTVQQYDRLKTDSYIKIPVKVCTLLLKKNTIGNENYYFYINFILTTGSNLAHIMQKKLYY